MTFDRDVDVFGTEIVCKLLVLAVDLVGDQRDKATGVGLSGQMEIGIDVFLEVKGEELEESGRVAGGLFGGPNRRICAMIII